MILLRHGIKKIRIKGPHESGFIVYSKISTLEIGLKKLLIRMPDSSGTPCGRKPYPKRKSLGLKKYPDTCRWGLNHLPWNLFDCALTFVSGHVAVYLDRFAGRRWVNPVLTVPDCGFTLSYVFARVAWGPVCRTFFH